MDNDPRWIAACKEFEAMGELAVHVAVTNGEFKSTPLKEPMAIEWLRLKEVARSEASSAKRDAREIKTLRIAILAIIIAVIAAAREIKWLITSIISWLH